MSTNYARPKWWQVYLTFPLLIGLFMVDSRLKLSTRGHQALQIGILLLVYGLVHLWLKANARALSNVDQRQFQGTVIVTRVPQQGLPEPMSDKRPMFLFPNSEIKGTLSDTFEMEIIDAQYIPVDEVPQELNKE
ncbi:MAG: hypothetical protein HY863_16450 [Chloroflexi bacterium]|nr:hypothetical protein [Chloroflexota bacterium]